MRRFMFSLSLLAVLAGTPLRIAETAHDIVCSLAEFDGDDAIRIPDGGVGDDSDVTIKGDSVRVSHSLGFADPIEIVMIGHQQTSRRVLAYFADRPRRVAETVTLRCALGQRLLC